MKNINNKNNIKNKMWFSKNMALINAAEKGDINDVKKLIKSGIDFEIKNNDNFTALYIAVFNGKLDIAKELIKAGADVNAKDYSGYNAINKAAINEHIDIIKVLKEAGGQNNREGSFICFNKINNITTLKGRLRRKDYIITAFVLTFLFFLIISIGAANKNDFTYSASIILTFPLAFIGFSATTKRLQDIGMSQWWILFIFLPYINFIFGLFLFFKDGTIGPNKYGEDPKGRTANNRKN